MGLCINNEKTEYMQISQSKIEYVQEKFIDIEGHLFKTMTYFQ